jgi:adenine-specific DNA-methyltransferase
MEHGKQPQIRLEDIKTLRVKMPNDDKQAPFVGRVKRILAAKERDPDADVSALEREIDELVYALYGLTSEEIQIVESASVKTPTRREGASK